MADEIRHVVSIEANLAKIQTQLRTLEGNFQSSFNRIGGLARTLAGTLGVGLSLGGITAFLRSSFAELEKQESAVASLRATLRSTGQDTEAYTNLLLNQAGALQQVTTFGDDAIIGLQQQLIAFGASGEQMQRLTELTLDLAAGMRTDLGSAALLVGKALSGNFATLTRYGISVDENKSKTEKLADALRQIEERFGGQARAQAETMTGAIKQMANAWGDLKEAIAGVIAQSGPLEKVIRGMTALLREGTERLQGQSLEAFKSTVKNLTEVSGRTTGLGAGKIALLSDEELRTLGEQSRTGKAEIFSLLEARKQLNDFLKTTTPPPAGELPKGKPLALVDPDDAKKSQSQVSSFFDNLNKELDQTRAKLTDSIFGPGSSLGDQLDKQLAQVKERLSADNLPIPADLDQKFAALKTQIIAASEELIVQKARTEDLARAIKEYDDAEAEAIAAGKELLGITRALDLEAMTPLEKTLAEINQRYDDLRVKAIAAAEATGQSADAIEVAVARARNFALLRADLAELPAEGNGGERRQEIDDLQKSLSDLGLKQAQAEELNLALGGGTDLLSQKIDIQRQRVEALTLAYGALSPQVKDAVAELKNLEGIQSLRESFSGIFDAIEEGFDQTLKGILQGTENFGEQMKNVARNILLSIGNELNKQFILNPLREQFQKLLPQLPGLGGAPSAGAIGATPEAAALSTAGTSLSASAVALNEAAAALMAAAGAQPGGALAPLGGTASAFTPNIQNFPNIAAPSELPIPDISEWTIELTDQTEQLFDSVGETIDTGLESLTKQSKTGFTGFFSELNTFLADAIRSLLDNLKGSSAGSGGSGGGFLGGLIGLFGGGGGAAAGAGAGSAAAELGVADAAGFIFLKKGGQVPHFQEGGEVPAILHEGEFVLRKSAVDKIGLPTLEKLNIGKIALPEFRFGGSVGSLAVDLRSYNSGGTVSGGAVSAIQSLSGQALRSQSGSNQFAVDVNINGDIIPKAPWITKDEAVTIGIRQLDNRGEWMQMIEQRTSIKGA